MSELQTTPRLSLFQIEAELLQLIEQREDAIDRIQAETRTEGLLALEKELATIHGLIREYIAREVKKVDGCAFAVKEYEARAKARAEAAAAMQREADRDAETAKRIKQMVLEVMQQFGEKKLSGRLFTISRQGNGGVRALTIAQPDLVPDTARVAKISLPLMLWRKVCQEMSEETLRRVTAIRTREVVEPDSATIREALERGEGVPGCRLEKRGEHICIR